MINIKITEGESSLTIEQLNEREQTLKKIAGLPELERIRVDAYATGLLDAARLRERESA